MSARHCYHIASTRPLAMYIESHVAVGACASASEMMRTAYCLIKERDEAATLTHLTPIVGDGVAKRV